MHMTAEDYSVHIKKNMEGLVYAAYVKAVFNFRVIDSMIKIDLSLKFWLDLF